MRPSLTIASRLLLIVVVATTGCFPINAHSGTDLSKINAFKIEKDKTTESELVQQFGPPTNTTLLSDGGKTLIWSGGMAKSHVNFIPFAWVAGADRTTVSTHSLMVTLRGGVAVDYVVNSGSQQY